MALWRSRVRAPSGPLSSHSHQSGWYRGVLFVPGSRERTKGAFLLFGCGHPLQSCVQSHAQLYEPDVLEC